VEVLQDLVVGLEHAPSSRLAHHPRGDSIVAYLKGCAHQAIISPIGIAFERSLGVGVDG
jgi:hypothetical protein